MSRLIKEGYCYLYHNVSPQFRAGEFRSNGAEYVAGPIPLLELIDPPYHAFDVADMYQGALLIEPESSVVLTRVPRPVRPGDMLVTVWPGIDTVQAIQYVGKDFEAKKSLGIFHYRNSAGIGILVFEKNKSSLSWVGNL